MDYKIRPIHTDEIYLLNDFIYEAIFQRDENNLLPLAGTFLSREVQARSVSGRSGAGHAHGD